jgi:flagellar motor switch protein FliN/FliY
MADLDDPKAWGLSEDDMENDGGADPFEQLQKEASLTSGPPPTGKPSTSVLERDKLDLGILFDVSLQVTVELGRTKMTVESLLRLSQGSVIELNRVAGEPLDIYVNNKLMARGEAVVVKEKFGVRITDVLSPDKRLEGLS